MSRGDSYIFRAACGCAFGLTDVRPGVTTEEQAWKSMYPTARERKDAAARGVHATREAWETYRHTVYDQLRGTHHCGQVAA